jgi:hypothetical protein
MIFPRAEWRGRNDPERDGKRADRGIQDESARIIRDDRNSLAMIRLSISNSTTRWRKMRVISGRSALNAAA